MSMRPPYLNVVGLTLMALQLGCGENASEYGTDGTCRIELQQVLRLAGDDVDFGLLRMTDNRVYLENRNRILVFDSKGQWLRTIGREGKGPGEFNNIAGLVPLPGNRLAVFDMALHRLTVVDSLGTASDGAPLPLTLQQDGALMLSDTSFVLGGRMTDPEARVRHPLVQINSSGSVLRYFGTDEAEKEGPHRGDMMPRMLVRDAQDRVISVPRYRYEVEEWDRDGALLRRTPLSSDWFFFPPKRPPGDPHLVGPPANQIVGLDVDMESRLWVLGYATPDDWAKGVADGKVVDYDAWVDAQIEVLHMPSLEVLCSVRLDQAVLYGFVKPGHIASIAYDREENPIITVWKLNLTELVTEPADSGNR
jgi:hypothetical protein